MAESKLITEPVRNAVLAVQRVRLRIPGWQRALAPAATEAERQAPDFEKLKLLLQSGTTAGPRASADELAQVGKSSATSLETVLGDHGSLLQEALEEAAKWWDSGAEASNVAAVISGVQAAVAALEAAMQHALFITFVNDVLNGHVGESRKIDDYCAGWGLSPVEVDMLWSWLLQDPLEFEGKKLPIALDTVNRCAYRKAENRLFLAFTALTPLWAAAVVFGLIALLFEILHAAGLTTWTGKWGWKMLVLLLFVSLGALAHLGSRALNVNYDDPMKVFDAGNIVDWLSLRWLSVLQMYVPVAVVVASLWGAGNIPTSFQKLGTAILAGYSADSFIRAALSKLQTQAASKQKPAAGNSAPS